MAVADVKMVNLLRPLQPRRETREGDIKDIALYVACIECGGPGKFRRCTGQYLCRACRKSNKYRLVTQSLVKKRYGLGRQDLEDAGIVPRATAVNPIRPRFAPMRLYSDAQVARYATARRHQYRKREGNSGYLQTRQK